MLPSADRLYGDADSTHPAGVGTCTVHTAKGTTTFMTLE